MRVELLRRWRVAYRGYEVREYDPGEHDMPDDLARDAAAAGVGRLIETTATMAAPEKKVVRRRRMRPTDDA